ncbi:LacI family DNA-binding transcriptional regulator [Actinoalloteichus spitiensis]|uniref:LacI family DNA-binding transcriptional regulator n=1 Tax=Actinoalloteichus spitiensis TaxID=252394 RepID=UPI000475400C|nr:LacI family DNA-binding transcriptional regulator [Actinoalloteichus spitiensis]
MAATLADVAARAGVSSATVSRVLNGNYPVAEATRRRVTEALRELNYVVNGPARALAAATSEVLGVLVNDVSDPFFGVLASGIQREAAEADLLTMICHTAGSADDELRYMELLLRQRARAIVVTGGGPEDGGHRRRTADLVRQSVARGTRVVFCGREAPPDSEAASVVFDNHGGAAALTRLLLAAGHRRIAYLTGPPHHTTSSARVAGARQALTEAGIDPDSCLWIRSGFSRAAGLEAGRELVRAAVDCTAVVAGNDLTASGVIASLRACGVRVPEDVSVAGFDDLPVAVDVVPELTTVRLPLRSGAVTAGRIATGTERTAPGVVVRMPAELRSRESVAAPGGGLSGAVGLPRER